MAHYFTYFISLTGGERTPVQPPEPLLTALREAFTEVVVTPSGLLLESDLKEQEAASLLRRVLPAPEATGVADLAYLTPIDAHNERHETWLLPHQSEARRVAVEALTSRSLHPSHPERHPHLRDCAGGCSHPLGLR